MDKQLEERIEELGKKSSKSKVCVGKYKVFVGCYGYDGHQAGTPEYDYVPIYAERYNHSFEERQKALLELIKIKRTSPDKQVRKVASKYIKTGAADLDISITAVRYLEGRYERLLSIRNLKTALREIKRKLSDIGIFKK